MKTRLGWLGPAIVALGVVIGGLGIWWTVHAKPEPGAVIDVLAIDAEWAVVVRAEVGGDRAFVELVSTRRGVEWQALVPPYAGRPDAPGLASAKAAISVRVTRTRPEVWAMSTRDATKLGAIKLDEYATGTWIANGPSRVVTAGDGTRSFEVVDGTGGAAIVAIDLEHGKVLWHQAVPGAIDELRVLSGQLAVETSAGGFRLDPATGARVVPPNAPDPLPPPVDRVKFPWPADARPFQPHHQAGNFVWIIRSDQLAVLDVQLSRIVATLRIR